MTKIEEPTIISKKRSWSTARQGRTPLRFRPAIQGGRKGDDSGHPLHQRPRHHQQRLRREDDGRGPLLDLAVNGKKPPPPSVPLPIPSRQNHHHPPVVPAEVRSVLERYRSLAIFCQNAAKRRRLESARRSARHAARLEQLAALKNMAAQTLELAGEVLRDEEERWRLEEEEEEMAMSQGDEGGDDVGSDKFREEMWRRAGREREHVEGLLRKYGMVDGDMVMQEDEEEGAPMKDAEDEDQQHLIGGIPSKFLDLTHFPGLRRGAKTINKKELVQKQQMVHPGARKDAFPLEKKDETTASLPIIDCTEECAAPSPRRRLHASYDTNVTPFPPPARIPPFSAGEAMSPSIPREVMAGTAVDSNPPTKRNTERIFVSNASLPHVNGTYVREGSHGGAPLFVRAGPPRKFMGKWDCGVVLRRERLGAGDEKAASGHVPEEGKGGYVWKIGLVPARRITHPRIIGYFVAHEDNNATPSAVSHVSKRVSNMDRMDEDGVDQDEDWDRDEILSSSCPEPPVDGWRVFQESNGTGRRATGLRVSYVD